MNRTQIREIFLRNGFDIKPGCDDLKSYVYAAAEELLNLAEVERLSAVQGEPVYLYRRLGLDDFVTCDFTRYTELSVKPHLFETKVLYTAPQPAPEVAMLVDELVEALEELVDLMEDTRQGEYIPDSFTTQPARIALEAYRKGDEYGEAY